jgi:hypothetical protein
MARVLRFDAGTLSAPVETPQGFLRIEGWASRAGIYEYENTREDEADGLGKAGAIRRELRPETEAFSDAVMNGHEGAPVTVHHPMRDGEPVMVDLKNVRTFEVGTTLGARRDGDRVAIAMVIKDKKTIAEIKAKKLPKLSPGYTADIILQKGADKRYAYAGNPNGEYDCIQSGVEINHNALCKNARGGAMQIRLDSLDVRYAHERTDETQESDETAEPVIRQDVIDAASRDFDRHMGSAARTRRGESMPDIKPEEQIALLNTKIGELEQARAAAEVEVKTQRARADEMEQKARTEAERVAERDAQIAAGADAVETAAVRKLQDRLDEVEREATELKASIPVQVAKRAELVGKAKALFGPAYRTDSLSDQQVEEAIIRKLRPNENLGLLKSGDARRARCDALFEDRVTSVRTLDKEREPETIRGAQRHDERADAEQKPLAHRDSWKQGLPNTTSSSARSRQKGA